MHRMNTTLRDVLLTSLFLPFSTAQDVRGLFQSRLSNASDVYLPSDVNYSNLTIQRWTTHGQPTYVASVRPGSEQDVVETISIASANNYSFLATGGGHGYTTSYAALRGGIEIDLGQLNSIDIDRNASTMTIGPGVLFRDIFDPVYEAGLEIQTGSCSCVGFIGATLGGGVGRYQGIHGMILDALLSVRLATANGSVVTASLAENSDLFWGIRGAGMNYGIVLSATYQLHPQTNRGQVMNADLVFPASANRSHWEIMQSFESTGLPPALTLVTATNWNDAYGGLNLVLNAVYAGPTEEGLAYLAPFFANGPILNQSISTIPWNTLAATASFGMDAIECEKGVNRNIYGLGTLNISIPVFEDYFARLGDLMQNHPETRQTHWILEGFPNAATRAIADDTTAYPHRDVFAQNLMVYVYPPNATELERDVVTPLAVEARANLSASGGEGTDGRLGDVGGVYVSYGHGDESSVSWYGRRKLDRLVALKREWDPRQLFGFNNPVPLSLDGI